MSVNAAKREGALKVKQLLGRSPLASCVDEYVVSLGDCQGPCDDPAAQVDGVNECLAFLRAKCDDRTHPQASRLGDAIRLGKAAGLIRDILKSGQPEDTSEATETPEDVDDDGNADRQN